MSDIAIRVEGLSKAYRIGLKEQRHETMLGAMAAWVKSPLSNFRDLRKLSHFGDIRTQGLRDPGTQGPRVPESLSPAAPSSQSPRVPESLSPPSDVIWALKDISFEVKHGEAVGIIGRNGAGKSTLLKILSRITEPTRGRAEVFGRVGSLLEVGTGFHPDLTGRENIYLNGTILGMKKREVDAKFDEIVAFSGVEKFIDTPVKRYSSGMRVRLGFSVAAHLEPEILIIDEVLAVGDAEFQKKCLGKMGAVAQAGRTVLFVSHNMQAITSLCKRALVLREGALWLEADSAAAVREYLASSAQSGAEVRWDDPITAPGDELLKLRAVRVLGNDGAVSVLHKSSDLIRIQFEFDLHQAERSLHIGFDLQTADGVKVLRSFHNDSLRASLTALPVGHNVLTCELPKDLLNAGTYYVSVCIGIHMVRWIVLEESLVQFGVEFTHGESQFMNNPERRKHGIIAPVLQWTGGIN
jgi:lipopolysaccharide transport system ATP-binding protein